MTVAKRRSKVWKRHIIEGLLIFLFGGTLQVIILCGDCLDPGKQWIFNFIYSGSYWLFLWKGSEFIVDGLDSWMPWIKFPLKRTLVSVFFLVIYSLFVTYFVDAGLDMVLLGKNFKEATAYPTVEFVDLLLVNLAANLIMHGRAFLFEWRQASIDMEKLRTEQVFTQFQSLKNQVNPHFLFNSLNALSSLVYEDQGKAVEFIRKLSQVYRYVLDRKDEEVIPIKDELDFLENFVFLQKIRFGDNLNFEIDGANDSGHLPPLALQLLVENAIKHNVVSDDHHLNIKVTIGEEYCEVVNNVKEKLSKDSTGIGLDNLQARYAYLSDKKVEIINEGDRFVVRLPVLTLNE